MFKAHIEEGTLSNGARYAFAHVPNAHFLRGDLNFNVGSMDEKPEEEGIAHYLEHVLIGNTPMFGDMQLFDYYRNMKQMDMNLTTSAENIQCYFHGLKDRSQDYFEHVKKFVTPKKFNKDIVEREKKIIISEIKNFNNNDARKSFYSHYDAVFSPHRIARNGLGEKDYVASVQPEDLFQFYTDHFRADKVTFTLAGKIDRNMMLDGLEEMTEGLPKGESAPRPGIIKNTAYNLYQKPMENIITTVSFFEKVSDLETGYNKSVMYETLYKKIYSNMRNAGQNYNLDYGTIRYKDFSVKLFSFVAGEKETVGDLEKFLTYMHDFQNSDLSPYVIAIHNAQEHNSAIEEESYIWRSNHMSNNLQFHNQLIPDDEYVRMGNNVSVDSIKKAFSESMQQIPSVTFYGNVENAGIQNNNKWISDRFKM